MSSAESVLHSDDVRLGHCNNTTIVPAQKLNNYRSNRWNARKSFLGVSGDCFTWSSAEMGTLVLRSPNRKFHGHDEITSSKGR